MNGFLKFALELAHMPEATVADLEKSLPGFSRIVAAAKELEPILAKMAPLVDQALPIVKRVYPDIVAVTPTVQELIQFAQNKGAA